MAYATKFYENSVNHEILAVAFEDGKAVATIRNLETSKLTGAEALEIARNGWPVSMLCANDFNNFLRPGGDWESTRPDNHLIAKTDLAGDCRFVWKNMGDTGYTFFQDLNKSKTIAYCNKKKTADSTEETDKTNSSVKINLEYLQKLVTGLNASQTDPKFVYTAKIYEKLPHSICVVILRNDEIVMDSDDIEGQEVPSIEDALKTAELCGNIPNSDSESSDEIPDLEKEYGAYLIVEIDSAGDCHFYWGEMGYTGFHFLQDLEEPEVIAYRIRHNTQRSGDFHLLCEKAGVGDAYASATNDESKFSILRTAAQRLDVVITPAKAPIKTGTVLKTEFYDITGEFTYEEPSICAVVYENGNISSIIPDIDYRYDTSTAAIKAALEGWQYEDSSRLSREDMEDVLTDLQIYDHLIAETDSEGTCHFYGENQDLSDKGIRFLEDGDRPEAIISRLNHRNWNFADCEQLCKLAGMEEEYTSAKQKPINQLIRTVSSAALKFNIVVCW